MFVLEERCRRCCIAGSDVEQRRSETPLKAFASHIQESKGPWRSSAFPRWRGCKTKHLDSSTVFIAGPNVTQEIFSTKLMAKTLRRPPGSPEELLRYRSRRSGDGVEGVERRWKLKSAASTPAITCIRRPQPSTNPLKRQAAARELRASIMMAFIRNTSLICTLSRSQCYAAVRDPPFDTCSCRARSTRFMAPTS